jgi:FlaA1/EpsC-like NDP-sugar epimerase
MGEPIRTADLAEKMIRLKGLEPGRDIQIVFTGLRPGEKLHEELVSLSERLSSTHHPKIHLAQSRPMVARDELVGKIRELSGNLPRSRDEIASRLQALARMDLRDTGEIVIHDAVPGRDS